MLTEPPFVRLDQDAIEHVHAGLSDAGQRNVEGVGAGVPANGFFGGQRGRSHVGFEAALAHGGQVALPDVQCLVGRVPGDSPDISCGLIERLGLQLANGKTPGAGEDRLKFEIRAGLRLGRKLERKKAGPRVGKMKIGVVARELGFECGFGTDLACGK